MLRNANRESYVTRKISRLMAALEHGHGGATLRVRGSVSSGTPPEQDMTLVLLLRENERERDTLTVPRGTTLTHEAG